MAVLCPHCQHRLALKDPKPGRYAPQCPQCRERFQITIANDAARTASVHSSAAVAATVAPSAVRTTAAVEATTLQAPASAPERSPSNPPPTAPRTLAQTADETGVWESRAPPSQESAATSSAEQAPVLGGYKLLQELGRGAMGAVYLARQLSLDRSVALKVIQPKYCDDPIFIARFTREAYAAAQLSHHNVVQIYDLGAEHDMNYFSMEYVPGETLAKLLAREGKLDIDIAVGYVIQAARGLLFAHEHGMVHRDVKPDNLLINQQGVLKIADLGLVKVPGATDEAPATPRSEPSHGSSLMAAASAAQTEANIAMGTPLYMAPEQAQNAAAVDHRADIYSLGCTLYVMLTGRPPFKGTSALEVITKHRSEPIVSPEVIVKRVPKQLADINMKMVSKNPDERYQSLQEVIVAMEAFLGIASAAAFSPREEQVQLLEQSVTQFNQSPLAKLRRTLNWGFFGGLVLLLAICVLGSWWSGVAAGLSLVLTTLLTYQLFVAGSRGSPLASKLREFSATRRWSDGLACAAGCLLVMVLVALVGVLLPTLLGALLGVGLGAARHFLIDRPLARQRQGAIDNVQSLLKSLRLRGFDEVALRQFIAKYSGPQWEEFFEELFGFDAKLLAREQLQRADLAHRRQRYAAWREPLVRWLEVRTTEARQAKEQKHLQKVAEAGLQAEGMDLLQARRKAQAAAESMVAQAADLRAAAREEAIAPTAAPTRFQKRLMVQQMLADARTPQSTGTRLRRAATSIAWGPLAIVLGPGARFIVGALLLVACLTWLRQNQILSSVSVRDADKVATFIEQSGSTQELKLRALPSGITLFLSGLNVGAAGLMLLVSAFFRGGKMGLFAVPAAAVTLLGPHIGVPGIGPLATPITVSIALGLTISALGYLFGRSSAV